METKELNVSINKSLSSILLAFVIEGSPVPNGVFLPELKAIARLLP